MRCCAIVSPASSRVGPRRVRSRAPPAPPGARPNTGEQLGALRRELNGLVAMHHHRTGKPHGVIHGELRRECGGPPTAIASAEQLSARIAALRRW